jgi:ATP-dependent protease ClpP protease subunit
MDLIMQPQNNLIIEMKATSALKNRRIYLSDEFDRDSIFEVVYFLDRIRDIDLRSGRKDKIELIIDSYGGVIYSGNLLLSKIEQLKDEGYEIITTTSGVAMSMGFIAAICGSKRYAYRHATFLVHQPSSGTWGTLKDIEDDRDETNRLWEDMKSTIKKYTKITEAQLNDIKERKHDWILNAQQALELGVIDKIL